MADYPFTTIRPNIGPSSARAPLPLFIPHSNARATPLFILRPFVPPPRHPTPVTRTCVSRDTSALYPEPGAPAPTCCVFLLSAQLIVANFLWWRRRDRV